MAGLGFEARESGSGARPLSQHTDRLTVTAPRGARLGFGETRGLLTMAQRRRAHRDGLGLLVTDAGDDR